MSLLTQKFQFSFQTNRGLWRWETVADLSGATVSYRIENIVSPHGRLRDNIPLDGLVVAEMGSSVTTVSQAFAPSILINPPGSLTFTVDEGRGVSPSQTFTITNNGIFGSFLVASLTPSDSYLEVIPGTLTGLIPSASASGSVSVDSTNLLATGSPYAASISVSDANAANNPQSLPVTVVVRPKATISLDALSLSFAVVKPLTGSFPAVADQTLTLTNTGLAASSLEYLIQKLTGLSPWLTGITPFTGTLAGGDSQVLTFSVVPPDTMLTGTYTETVRITGYSTNNQVDVTVTLEITLWTTTFQTFRSALKERSPLWIWLW